MSEFYSQGINGVVYKSNRRERLWFPDADLVKVDNNLESADTTFATKFYEHLIAHLLFPDNFINVRAARLDKSILQRITESLHIDLPILFDQRFRLYSELASVDPVHAVFSEHMFEDVSGAKAICNCDVCYTHHEFHKSKDLRGKAEDKLYKTSAYGIFLPYSDQSDYCVGKTGELIFFEIERFIPEKLITQLQITGVNTDSEARALTLTKRYQALLR